MNAPQPTTLKLVAVLPADEIEHLTVLGQNLAAVAQDDEEDYPLVRVYEVAESR